MRWRAAWADAGSNHERSDPSRQLEIGGEWCGPALSCFLIKRWIPVLDQLLFEPAAGPCVRWGIGAEANAELMGHLAALKGFAIGSQIGLAIVLTFPAPISGFGFPHIKKKWMFKVGRTIQHEINGGSAMGTVSPTPEAQREWGKR